MTAKSRAHKVQKELKRKKNNDRSAPQPDPARFEERLTQSGETPGWAVWTPLVEGTVIPRYLGEHGPFTPEHNPHDS